MSFTNSYRACMQSALMFFTAVACLSAGSLALADKPVDQLPQVSAPAGSDIYYTVQGGVDYRSSLDQIRAWDSVSVTGGAVDGTAIGLSVPDAGSFTTLTTTGNAGLGEPSPVNLLDVSGGMVIGSNYAGAATAPANGLSVEGNVGIGINSPAYPLQVRKNGAGQQSLVYLMNSQTPATNVGVKVLMGGGVAQGSLATGWEGAASTDAYMAISTTGGSANTEKLRITSGGNVGIGAISPANKLDVSGGSVIGATYAGSITSPTNGLLVEGNVGIGRATAAYPLSAQKDGAGMQYVLAMYNGQTPAAGVGVGILPIGGAKGMGYAAWDWEGASDTDSRFTIGVRNADVNTNVLRITSDGNMGVGTTTPTAALDINSDTIRVRTAKTPASSSETCDQGTLAWDATYLYACVAANTWKRIGWTTF